MKPPQRCIVVVVLAVLGGCPGAPKPATLLAYEQLRQAPHFAATRSAQPVLIGESLAAWERARRAWQDGDEGPAGHWATMAMIKYRSAEVLAERAAARQRLREVSAQLRVAELERRQLDERKRHLEEKIELYEQLALARVDTKVKEMELDETQQQAQAQKKLIDAQVALKQAEAVEADVHSSRAFGVARELLSKATEALRAEQVAQATKLADLAREKADAAYQEARPQYLSAKEAAARKARHEQLQQDAKAITGIEVRVGSSGETQQLILPVVRLFDGRSADMRHDKLQVLNGIAALLKQYPTYPVLINGHTSTAIPAKRRYAVSEARARRVAHYLLTLGLPLDRFAISGRGEQEPVGRPASPDNNRVDVVLLFQ